MEKVKNALLKHDRPFLIDLLNKQKEKRILKHGGIAREERTLYLENEKEEVRMKKKRKSMKRGFYSHLCSVCLQ